jgi:2-polyprenyl-3-methyl-5-hydroxy-6-metoxy-1,4-benzoquinol methylase
MLRLEQAFRENVVKVDDLRPEAAMAGQRAAMQLDIDWLAARRRDFVFVACPACGADEPLSLYEKFGMPQVRCQRCETQYVNPRPTERMLADFYAQSANYAYWARHIFPASKDVRRERLFRPRAQLAGDVVRRAGISKPVLVEVGAAYGQFCSEALATNAFSKVIAIEPTPDLAQVCRDLGIDVLESPYEDVTFDAPVGIIACFEVIEHLFDPKRFLSWCHASLQPGGIVLLTCPNSAGFDTLLLGSASSAVDHEHLNLFTPQSLALLAQRCGFEIIEVSTPGELDVDLVRRAVADGEVDRNHLGPLISRLIENADPAQLQVVIRDAGLSSNMRLIARRPVP